MHNSPKTSAGLLPYRHHDGRLEVVLGHMGGPFWARKDDGAWSIIKGEPEPGEDPYQAARREFAEETGLPAPSGAALELGELAQPGGKQVTVWAIESNLDPSSILSNTFTIEWPRGSGQHQRFPELDRAGWFDTATARHKLVRGQRPFIDRLEQLLCRARGS